MCKFISRQHVEAGLICIFIEPRIANEARVSSYIQAILRHEDIFLKEKTFQYVLRDKMINYRGT